MKLLVLVGLTSFAIVNAAPQPAQQAAQAGLLDKSTNIAVINLTPYTFHQLPQVQSFQLKDWEKRWPKDIRTGASAVKVESALSIKHNNPADGAGIVSYQVTDDKSSEVRIQVEKGAKSPLDAWAVLQGISTSNNAQGTFVDLDWAEQSWTPLILGGKSGSLVGNNPPTDWMAQNLPHIGCLPLQSLIMPGSHDAGMSQIQDNTKFSGAQNTQTQTLNVKDQLSKGVRWFDIRPTLKGTNYKTGHWSDTKSTLGWQGSNGQSMADIIANVNDFTSNNKELVVLYLSHSVNINNKFSPFNDNDWEGLLKQLQGLKNLYQRKDNDVVDNLLTVPLSDFIKDGPAVVVVCNERDADYLKAKGFYGHGFWPQSAVRRFDSYANTDDLNKMRADQYGKLMNAANHKDQLFVLSWTMSLTGAEDANLLDSIRQRANYVNSRLFEVGKVPTSGPVQWVDYGANLIPNVIMIDNVLDNKVAALAVAMNRQMGHLMHQDCGAA